MITEHGRVNFLMEEVMSPKEYEAAIAAFIRVNGVTRCPTACVAPTQASTDAVDRAALRRRAKQREAMREERARTAAWLRAVGAA